MQASRNHRRWTLLCVATAVILVSDVAFPGQRALVESAVSAVESADFKKWVPDCQEMQHQIAQESTRITALRPSELEDGPIGLSFSTVEWDGLRINVPNASFSELVLIPGGLSALKGDRAQVFVMRLNLTAHFNDVSRHELFKGYSDFQSDLVGWLEAGLLLGPEDLRCRPDTMSQDVVGIVHLLLAQLAVVSSGEVLMTRFNEPSASLLLVDRAGGDDRVRLQYYVQHPGQDRVELLHLIFYMKAVDEPMQTMRGFVEALQESSGREIEVEVADVLISILEGNDDDARSAAVMAGLKVSEGLPGGD